MKRIFGLLFIMFAAYLLIQLGYTYLSKGYEIKYDVNGYNVFEKYIARTSGEKDSYYIEVTDGTDTFILNTYKNFNKQKELVKDVHIINVDKYKCAYIELKIKDFKSNITCINNGIYYNYEDIKGKNSELDKKIGELNYDLANFTDTAEEVKRTTGIFVSQANLINKQFMGLTSYRGIYLINNYSDVKFLYEIDLFEEDNINQKISAYVNHYYLVADYNQKYTFDKFYLIDITFGDKKEIKYHSKISFDSYIMGVIGDKVYLLDCDNKKQYEIDITERSIIEVGNENIGIKYYNNGEWEKMNYVTAVNNKPKFNINSIKVDGYERVDLIGGKETGYKYYYKKNGNKYDVYRSMQKNDKLTYLFTTTSIDNIVYYNDYVYFQDGEYIKCYQDNIGVKKIYHAHKEVFSGIYKFGVSNE